MNNQDPNQNPNPSGVLNLDEVLGGQRLRVRYQGKEYALRSVNSLSTEQFRKVMSYANKFSSLQEEDLEEGSIEFDELLQGVDDLLEIIAPSLPRYKPSFWERFKKGYKRKFLLSLQETIRVMQYWSENDFSKNAVGAVVRNKRKRHR